MREKKFRSHIFSCSRHWKRYESNFRRKERKKESWDRVRWIERTKWEKIANLLQKLFHYIHYPMNIRTFRMYSSEGNWTADLSLSLKRQNRNYHANDHSEWENTYTRRLDWLRKTVSQVKSRAKCFRQCIVGRQLLIMLLNNFFLPSFLFRSFISSFFHHPQYIPILFFPSSIILKISGNFFFPQIGREKSVWSM